MNRSSATSSIHRKRIPPPAKIQGGNKQSPRNPLQDLNGTTSISSTCSSNASSIEAPKGCLRFFLSHSSSKTPLHGPKTVSKTPKSAPSVRLSKPSKYKPRKENSLNCTGLEKSVSQKVKKKPPCLYQWNSGKKPNSRNAQKLKYSSNNVSKLEYRSEQHCLVRMIDDAGESNDADFTPLCKLASGSGLECNRVMVENSNPSNSITKTPPIQASVSPEIQCGSSVLLKSTATPVCYGAGHVLSGITDKRKCRPRGILTAGEGGLSSGKAGVLNCFDEDNEIDTTTVANNSSVSLVPLAAEASMHWLLSPSNEENEDQKWDAGKGSLQSPKSADYSIFQPPFDLHNQLFTSDVCNNSDLITPSTNNTSLSRSPFLVSPTGIPEFQEILRPLYDRVAVLSSSSATRSSGDVNLKEERDYKYSMAPENSPLSMESLGSENVMRTPESYSSSDRHVNLSWLNADNNKKHDCYSELDMMSDVLHMPSLSPNSRISMWEPASLSFQFDCSTTPSTSIDLTRFRRVLDDKISWASSSTLENVSQSQMRISWREGLASRIFEMDEFDCCRCLSDEDEDIDECSNHKLKSDQSPGLNVDAPIITNDSVDNEQGLDGNSKESLHPKMPSSCAESISTDGGGLTVSGDSDWTLCYKNQLFEI